LTNPVYRGNTAYQNGQVISNTHVPIISREEAAQVDRLLRRNRRLPPRTASAPRSLAGLVVCGECQSKMTVSRVVTPRKTVISTCALLCPSAPSVVDSLRAGVVKHAIAAICRDLPRAVDEMNLPQLDGEEL